MDIVTGMPSSNRSCHHQKSTYDLVTVHVRLRWPQIALTVFWLQMSLATLFTLYLLTPYLSAEGGLLPKDYVKRGCFCSAGRALHQRFELVLSVPPRGDVAGNDFLNPRKTNRLR